MVCLLLVGLRWLSVEQEVGCVLGGWRSVELVEWVVRRLFFVCEAAGVVVAGEWG